MTLSVDSNESNGGESLEREKKWIRDIVRHGSRRAADALVRSYYDEIYAFVYRQTGKREDALDLTQECFLAALRSISSYDSKKSGFRTWLYHIAAHKVIDLRRKQRIVYYSLDEQEEIADEQDFTLDIQNKELLAEIEQLVSAQDPLLQEIYRLRVYGEHTFPQIADATAQPESKVKAQYYRLIAKIKKNHE